MGFLIRSLIVGSMLVGSTSIGGSLHAKPFAPEQLCEVYSTLPMCVSGTANCSTCHTDTPSQNSFGTQITEHLLPDNPRPLSNEEYKLWLPAALKSIEALDADGDGASNLEELMAGSSPGDATSSPEKEGCSSEDKEETQEMLWNVCEYDNNHAYKKVFLDFCGHSPNYQQMKDFAQAAEQKLGLQAAFQECLKSDYWLGVDGALWNMANDKIRPLAVLRGAVDPEEAGEIGIAGDYHDDYNLFVYSQSGDRDARDLLTAKYFVKRAETDSLQFEVFTPNEISDLLERGFTVGQLTKEEDRSGILTTRWTLMMFTMFTAIPRTTAAQMYRSYLGKDIALMEGLSPVHSEPIDYDEKGVAEAECAVCHSTLDPMSYPFSRYYGFPLNIVEIVTPLIYQADGYGDASESSGETESEDDILSSLLELVGSGAIDNNIATYNAGRLDDFVETENSNIVNTPEEGYLLGEPVQNVVEWGRVAANSDEFAKATVMDYWKLLIGKEPQPSEFQTFEILWKDFMGKHEYRVEKMLADLIQTEAYGQP